MCHGLCFALWLVCAPAGWPIFEPEQCTWRELLFVRSMPFIGMAACLRVAQHLWRRQLRADATGIELINPGSESWSLRWEEISQWGPTRGGWDTTESEGGTKYFTFNPGSERLSLSLVGGRQLRLFLPIFGHTKAGGLLAVLRRYAGNREAGTSSLAESR